MNDKKNISSKLGNSNVEIITHPGQINNEAIYSCILCPWSGKHEERKKERDEGQKGFYRVCPECGCKDFNKLDGKTYQVLTFSVDSEIENTIRKYTVVNGLPKGYNPD